MTSEDGSAPSELRNIYRDSRVGNLLLLFGVVMFAVFIASAYVMALHRDTYPKLSIALSAIWVVGVPVFFFVEHTVIFRKYGDPSQYEHFKRVQELAGKIWAAAIVVMGGFFLQRNP